jgi:hypothetical protein
MLRKHQTRLLTAYIDGELDAADRRAVEQLLVESREARALWAKLENDSKDVRGLPVHKAPDTLADVVMETLNDQQPSPILQRKLALPSSRPAIPTWARLAVAASLLLAVGVCAFFAAGGLMRRWEGPDAISTMPKKQAAPLEKDAADDGPKPFDPFFADLVASAAKDFGSAVKEKDTGVRLMVKELNLPATAARLGNELKKAPGFLLDVPTANTAKAVERFEKAFETAGIPLLIETGATASLAKKLPKVSYILYAEDLRQEDITHILQHFGVGEATSTSGSAVERMVMKSLTDNDRKNVANSMRVAVEKLAPAKSLSGDLPTLVDAPPAMTNTGALVALPPRAFLMTASGADPQKSEELRRFLTARRALRPGTVQVVVLIHELPA